MGPKSKREDYQSKLSRDMHNFHHDGGNRFNAYGGNKHGNGNFTPRRQVGVGIEDKERNMEKELGTTLEESPISVSLIPSLMCYEVSFVELEFFLESYLSHVSIYEDLYAISFGGDLFLVVPYVSKCLSSLVSLEDPLMRSGVKFDPSCYGFRMLDNASFADPNIVSCELECALFYVLLDKSMGKYVKQCYYVLPFLGVFMRNINGFILLKQHEVFLNEQIAFVSGKYEPSIEVTTFFGNTFGFKIYHLHFKKFLLKDFETEWDII
ncbi:hypothetical protein M9H77_22677 [Catharanthus roseus]|uniref:Uncharacterized protein n=1 Tax=Catharanthus roseus TaxID=4058 RepID=A0ACC0AR47_CATRO|nr:hypothetical protein M9H77_22677 [Catharanthus roseus]